MPSTPDQLRRPIALTFLALAALSGCATPHPSTEVRGRLVQLHADLSPAEAATLAADADLFLADAARYLGVPAPSPRIYAFTSRWRLWRFLRRKCPAFARRAGACFIDDEHRLVIALRVRAGQSPRGLRHELTHAVIAANFREPMPWLDEGLAQVLEDGCPPTEDRDRLRTLLRRRRGVDSRLERILGESEHEKLSAADYLVAWGFVWFLLEEPSIGRRAVLRCLRPPLPGQDTERRTVRCLGRETGDLARGFSRFLSRREVEEAIRSERTRR